MIIFSSVKIYNKMTIESSCTLIERASPSDKKSCKDKHVLFNKCSEIVNCSVNIWTRVYRGWLFHNLTGLSMVQYTSKVLFSANFFYLLISFEDKKEVLAFFTCIIDLNLENLNYKLKPNTNFVYITKHCVHCISIITRLLMLNFLLEY